MGGFAYRDSSEIVPNLGTSGFDGGIKKDQDTYGHSDSLPAIELMGHHVKNRIDLLLNNILSGMQTATYSLFGYIVQWLIQM